MGLSTPSHRASLTDGLRSMKLDLIGEVAELARYIGYWKPYATSHEGLDANRAIQTGGPQRGVGTGGSGQKTACRAVSTDRDINRDRPRRSASDMA
ncbi:MULTISPECIES: hypothetical protein [unclassified Mesorhizobium]|uniref:hypothetical protein n=2 Tax=unclassified Mesorhizobium TaxID=325217 RepID=UPI00112E79CB|nr:MULTISPECIES: hypothetical protein [unclassified Mesorhizobium]TPJ40657.1 hypothetical protein FJ437_25710 [Mesorhizobium sp. B2-6-6]MCA0006226.1 hypothetical protein [Mesorhizobium sp. B264B1B]TPK02391.1 hypothetical protein FJ491_05815 [Mesorhizobium sp. B2-5-10]TPK09876.1 hypothetical protein FJ490_16125 [Mesorhizobium sp. B2-5-11]TPK34715.1 hypothetical protein FJ885_10965 [Mesorhizobium sp. B2-5-8]